MFIYRFHPVTFALNSLKLWVSFYQVGANEITSLYKIIRERTLGQWLCLLRIKNILCSFKCNCIITYIEKVWNLDEVEPKSRNPSKLVTSAHYYVGVRCINTVMCYLYFLFTLLCIVVSVVWLQFNSLMKHSFIDRYFGFCFVNICIKFCCIYTKFNGISGSYNKL